MKRNFNADHPDQLWVSDFTYIQTHSGWVYTALLQIEIWVDEVPFKKCLETENPVD